MVDVRWSSEEVESVMLVVKYDLRKKYKSIDLDTFIDEVVKMLNTKGGFG